MDSAALEERAESDRLWSERVLWGGDARKLSQIASSCAYSSQPLRDRRGIE